jgi:hypothetical protein
MNISELNENRSIKLSSISIHNQSRPEKGNHFAKQIAYQLSPKFRNDLSKFARDQKLMNLQEKNKKGPL